MKTYLNIIIDFLLKHIIFIIWAFLTVFLYYFSSLAIEQFEIKQLVNSEKEFTLKEDSFFADNNMIGCLVKRYFNPSNHKLIDSVTVNGVTINFEVDFTLNDTTEVYFMYIRESKHNVISTVVSVDKFKDLNMIDIEKQSWPNQVSSAEHKLNSHFKRVNNQKELEQGFNNIESIFHKWTSQYNFVKDSIEQRIDISKVINDSIPFYTPISHPQNGYVMVANKGKVLSYFAFLSLIAFILSMAIAFAIITRIKKYGNKTVS
jgi:hypothetical protein